MKIYEAKNISRQADTSFLSAQNAEKVCAYHRSFPQYSPTPCAHLQDLAKRLGVKDIAVKDESKRFGLNAFKVLGGSYAIGKILARRLDIPDDELTFERLSDPSVRAKTGGLTFVTATDGNHGRGVAWTARTLGYDAVVYMPKGTKQERLDNINITGAKGYITELNYDDAVRLAEKDARENGRILVQDTSMDGYTEIPRYIIQGYATMAYEIVKADDFIPPTHIFVQAGVGSMACAVVGFFAEYLKDKPPVFTVVEPDAAACIFATASAQDGKMHPVTGDMDTIQAGLACGEPCPIAWDVLKENVSFYLSIPDTAAAEGMRVLARPQGNDPAIVSGESGASGFGALYDILTRRPEIRKQLGIGSDSVVLCISTEGDTCRENYIDIVENGKYPVE